jgi:hypothetical protein
MQFACTLDLTIDRSFRIYCGCDPSNDVSLVEIFAADKEKQITIQCYDFHSIELCMQNSARTVIYLFSKTYYNIFSQLGILHSEFRNVYILCQIQSKLK